MKKIIAFISALTLCVPAFSCGKKSDKKEKNAKTVSVEPLGDVSYKKTELPLPEDIGILYYMKPFNNSSEFFLVSFNETSTYFWTADSQLSSFKKITLDNLSDDNFYNFDVTNDGTIVIYSCDEDGTIRLVKMSMDGTILSDEYNDNFRSESGEYLFAGNMASNGNIIVVELDGNYEIFSTNGTHICALTLKSDEMTEAVGKDSSGRIICAVRTADDKLQLRYINSDGKTEDASEIYDFTDTLYPEIIPGSGDYSMFMRSSNTIYGVKKDSSAIEPLFSTGSAAVPADSITGYTMCEDGNFAIITADYAKTTSSMKKYTPCSPDELEQSEAITLFMQNPDDEMTKMIEKFNDSRTDCRISTKVYSSDFDKAFDEMTQDALSGNLPDIIRGTSLGSLDLLKNEALCDLYEFIDKDDTLTRDAFLPEYLAEIDGWYGGHIYNIPNFFRIKLPYTAKSKFLDGIETWDTAAFLDVVESIPAEMKPDINLTYESDTQVNRRQMLFVNHWMDYNTLECSFDTPEFARYIEFCKKGIPAEEYVEIPADEQIKRQEELATAFVDEKILFTEPQLLSYSDYLILKEHTFAGVDFGFMGNIGSGGAPAIEAYFSDALSITKDCSDKDAAWDFIKMFYTDEYYNSAYEGGYGFPVTVSGMKNFREKEKSPREYKYDEALKDYGGVAVYSGKTDENGTALYDMLGYVDDKVIAEADALISAAKLPKKTVSLPVSGNFEEMNNFYNEFYGIYFEETDRFFYGEITAEECGKMLQNRYSIYLSENYD